MKKRFFGYSVRDVEDKVEALNRLIELQKKDIEFLKRDNDKLRSVLNDISEANEITRNF